jgi:RNA polymerase sigma factor (sigma-70 family)
VTTTTRRLAEAARADTGAGFAALHARVARQLVAWAALHVTPPLRALVPLDDLVQEVWARAFAAFASYDPQRGSFRGWLVGIAYNVLREQLRAGYRRRPAFGRPPSGSTSIDDVADPATSIGSRLTRDEATTALVERLDGLDEVDRRLVAWRAIEELPYDEIGRRLGVSGVAAESRWRRLAERLRELLAAAGLGPPAGS